MKHTRKALIALGLAAALSVGALAAGAAVNITVTPGIKVLVDGEEFVPKDANGKAVDVFAYEGTTYVPIRAVSEAFGLKVDYDAGQQAAVITSPAQIAAPNPNVETVFGIAPEPFLNDEGQKEISYTDIEYDFHWWLEDQDQKITVELVSGELPEGIELKGDKLLGQVQGVADQLVTFQVTPKKGDVVERTLRFQFTEGDQFNAAPVVIWGVEGDLVEAYVPTFYNGILYTGGDEDPNMIEAGYAPIGSQAALDELAQYGLSLTYQTRTEDKKFYWADNFVTGTLTGATDGWVKVSVPVYAGMGSPHVDKDGNLEHRGWWITGDGDDARILSGSIDVYVNILPLDPIG